MRKENTKILGTHKKYSEPQKLGDVQEAGMAESLVESPESEALGRAEEHLDRGSGAALFVSGRDSGCYSVQVQGSDIVEVGRETGPATQTLLS